MAKRWHMDRALRLLIILILLSPAARTQDLIWSNNYGGQYHEFGNSCTHAGNGDLMLVGSTFSFGNGSFDFYLVKIDSLGNRLMEATFGGESTEYGYDITATADGGFVLVGSTKSYGAGAKNVYLVKVDASGELLWSRTFGGADNDEGRSVRQTADGGFIICGGTYSSGAGYEDVYLVKTDASGNLVWQKTYGGGGGESGKAVRQTPDGGYVTVGSTGSFGEGYSSIYVVRTDSNGDSLWATTYGGAKADYGYSVEIAQDGGLVIVGATASFGAGSSDAYMIKTDPTGFVEWERTYGGADDDRAYSVLQTAGGNYVLSGSSLSFSSNFNVYVVKANPAGDMIWSRNYGGSESDYCESAIIDIDNDYVLIGRSFSYTSGGSDVYVLKLMGDQMTDVFEPMAGELPSEFNLRQNYPNPFNMSTVIEFSMQRRSDVMLSIYNILGQAVRRWPVSSLPAGVYRFEWDGTSDDGREVASGVYFYNLQAENYTETKKMLMLK